MGGSFRDLADLACEDYVPNYRFIEKYEIAGDLEKSQVLEIEVESDAEASKLATRINRAGRYGRYRLYDVDIPSPQVYLYKKDLFPLALAEVEERNGRLQWTLKDDREKIDFLLPPLRKIRLEVKTRGVKRVRTFDDELDTVEIKRDGGDTVVIDSGTEAEKLLSLVDFFKEADPDVVITEGGDSFIFPYLARRAQENRILDRLILGRDPSPLRVYEVQGHSYFSYGKILYRETAARLLGRLHIDGRNAYISADCGLEGLFEISRTCIIPLQRASRATIGTNMTSLQLYQAVKQEVLIPWNKSQPEEWKNGLELIIADRGGMIYEPSMGVHENVGELDFSSLYPTLMMKKNLSGETVKCKCCPNSPLRVPELDYNICQKRTGIVSGSLKILLERRMEYKKRKKQESDLVARQVYEQRQAALKWILVCCLAYDSPVIISRNGRVSYQKIGKVVDELIGDPVGVFDCPEEMFVAGVDKELKSRFCRVAKLIKTPATEKLLHVKMEDGRQVKCTSNHTFYVLREGGLVEAKAENLKKGDLVPVAKNVVNRNEAISNLDLLERLQEKIVMDERDSWRVKSDSLREQVSSSAKDLETVLKNEGRHVQNVRSWLASGIVPFRYLDLLSPHIDSKLQVGRGRVSGGRVAWLPASLDIDEELGFFLGFYVADGSAGENFIRLDVGGKEGEIVDHLTTIVRKKFGLVPKVYRESKANMFVVQVNSVSLVQILNRIFDIPSSSSTGKLKVPPLLFNASREAILGFFSGLLAGDGSVNKRRQHIEIATHSYDLAVELGYLANLLGLSFNIIRGKRLHRIYFVGPAGLRPFENMFLKKTHRTRFRKMRTSCDKDCHHAVFEMFPVNQTRLRGVAAVARTVRTPRLEGRNRVCPERAKISLTRIARNPRFSRLQEAHAQITKLLGADVGFVAVKDIEQIDYENPYVYCFEIADDDESFPAFFTGSGGVLVHNSFGYLGFKNARFGKIDAHIATCAFSRQYLTRAVAIAESEGFKLLHGIVDSMWLSKPGAGDSDYSELAAKIEKELGLPLSFEARYKWIVFLNSRMNPSEPVLNRYYGVFQDGTIKTRGIELRRHDTPEIVNRCQEKMVEVLSKASDCREFMAAIPRALRVLEEYVALVRSGGVAFDDLVIEKNLSKNPGEYTNTIPQTIAARRLMTEGGNVHAGQRIRYVLTTDRSLASGYSAVPTELVDDHTRYNAEMYVELLIRSATNLFLPFGYDTDLLKRALKRTMGSSSAFDSDTARILA